MSTQPEHVDPAVAAHENLIAKVAQPVFFQKLASHGIVPNTQEEAQALLNMGANLFDRHSQAQAKSASTRTNLIMRAHQGLNDIGKSASDASDQSAVYMANLLISQDPDLIKSAIAVQRALIQPATAYA